MPKKIPQAPPPGEDRHSNQSSSSRRRSSKRQNQNPPTAHSLTEDEIPTAILPSEKEDNITPVLFENVDTDLIKSFLILIRDGYPKAHDAMIFLESETDVAATTAMANIRDALSHFSSFLSGKLDRVASLAQISNAEEHLRRALLEPYESAYKLKVIEVKAQYRLYKKYVLPNKASYDSLRRAPSESTIDKKLTRIVVLGTSGRHAKGKNIWTPKWERGVANLMEACKEANELYALLSKYLNLYEQSEPGTSLLLREVEIKNLKARLSERERKIEMLQQKIAKLQAMSKK